MSYSAGSCPFHVFNWHPNVFIFPWRWPVKLCFFLANAKKANASIKCYFPTTCMPCTENCQRKQKLLKVTEKNKKQACCHFHTFKKNFIYTTMWCTGGPQCGPHGALAPTAKATWASAWDGGIKSELMKPHSDGDITTSTIILIIHHDMIMRLP